MEASKNLEKAPCSKCGDECFKLCYVGGQLVCVDCFRKACEKAEANKPVPINPHLTP